jgi:hypothetical protein
MGRDLMRYDLMAQDALRGLVREALARAATEGLPGEHHFYITFATGFAGVEMPDDLRERFPTDMIIVLQHQFWDLEVRETDFSVTLHFNHQPRTLTVPFKSIISFVDPSVQFGLRFQVDGYEPAEPAPGDAPLPEPAALPDARPEEPPAEESEEAADSKTGEVVDLNAFRKNS